MSSKETFDKLLSKYPNPVFLIPTYKSINAHSFQHMLVFFTQLMKYGFNPNIFILDQTNVCVSRNKLVEAFLESDQKKDGKYYNIVTWLDSDHTFETQDWLDLVNAYDELDEVDVISANYTTRDNVTPQVCGFARDGERFRSINPFTTGIVEVDAFGFGFCVMNKSVLQSMYNEYGLHQFIFRTIGDKFEGGIIGEDMDWCDKAQKLGYKLYYDMDIVIGHVGLVMDNNLLKIIKRD